MHSQKCITKNIELEDMASMEILINISEKHIIDNSQQKTKKTRVLLPVTYEIEPV
jgi:hypothetical protein